jgi:hypothetical protein
MKIKKDRKLQTNFFFFGSCKYLHISKIDHLENLKLPKMFTFEVVKVRFTKIWSIFKERSVFGNLCKMRLKTI